MSGGRPSPSPLVLSYVQVEPILCAREAGEATAVTSTDLGLTSIEVKLESDGGVFPGNVHLSWESLEGIVSSRNHCFLIQDGGLRPIQAFSEVTGRHCSLYPTERAPTLLLAGFPMHRIKDIDPVEDTLRKIATIRPVVGRVLDTSTGLGYTAIEAARTADYVVTLELDPAVLEVARLNPWSRRLFEDPKIQQRVGDSFDVVQELEAESFSRIVHDPPTFSLAGDLYSEQFYRELYRVLRRTGRLFHYVGDLESRSGGRVAKGVAQRLQAAGFTRVVRRPEAFGFAATK